MKKLEIFPDTAYANLVKMIGPYRYNIYNPSETLPNEVFKNELNISQYKCVFACVGATQADYNISLERIGGSETIQNVIVPKDREIIAVRLLRKCNHDGTPHYNADDQIIFPTNKGDVYRISRRNAPDHYIPLTKNAGISSIADAYNLPDLQNGPIDHYDYNGASLHFDLKPKENDTF